MSVRVPSGRVDSGGLGAETNWLTASFALDASRPRLVERGGTIARDDSAAEEDPVLCAARRACLEGGREPPTALRIRVVSRIENSDRLPDTVAGALGVRALLDLALDDAAIARIAADCDGGDVARAARIVAAHTVVTQPACDD